MSQLFPDFPGPAHERDLLAWTYHRMAGQRMLELGSKQFGAYKRYFERTFNMEHVSVDLNGAGGALALDLQEPLNLGQFECVTNFGTSEHVEHQEPVWRNMLESLKLGGYLLSTTPYPGDWLGHGRWYPPDGWYADWCAGNGLQIHELSIVGAFSLRRRMVCVVAERTAEVPWQWPATPMYESPRGKVGAYI